MPVLTADLLETSPPHTPRLTNSTIPYPELTGVDIINQKKNHEGKFFHSLISDLKSLNLLLNFDL